MPATQTTNFLLVEDDPIAINVTQRGFEMAPAGVQLQFVTDGIKASRYIGGMAPYADRHIYPLPDVIILDINLPRLGGFDFLRWLRDNAPVESRSTPVIIISSSGSSNDAEWARALGVQMFLLKPVKWPKFWEELAANGLLKLSENPA